MLTFDVVVARGGGRIAGRVLDRARDRACRMSRPVATDRALDGFEHLPSGTVCNPPGA
jgi:hypothetical protein